MAEPVLVIIEGGRRQVVHHLGCRELHSTILVAGIDIATDRFEVEVQCWSPTGPVEMPGWISTLLDPATGLWETSRLSRRAARRQRGRARTSRRAAAGRP